VRSRLHIDLAYTWSALPHLLRGALITLEVSLAAMLLSFAIGSALTILRLSEKRFSPALIRAYISYIRGTPLLIQIFLIYYMLPRAGLQLSPLVSGIIALGLSSAAFTAEIMRGGITAIPNGQVEAARSLGMSRPVTWAVIILPQLFYLILPPLINEFTHVIKGTPLISVITVVELMRIAQQIYNVNFHPLEVMIGVALVFVAMNFTLLRVGAFLERQNAIKLAYK
jgi:polar amino acid transport system permease protein